MFLNLDRLAELSGLMHGRSLLGARWSFFLPSPESLASLTEYSLPGGVLSFSERIASRTGVKIVQQDGARSSSLYSFLATGQTAIAVVDSFHLPYRPAFGRVHSHRTILVRQGLDPTGVLVEDEWPPAYHGPVPVRCLEAARYSEVPLDPVREPVFAGGKIRGEWFHLEMDGRRPDNPGLWLGEVLISMYEEAVSSARNHDGLYGLCAMSEFLNGLTVAFTASRALQIERLRAASLLLRSELSSRVFMCAFLKTAGKYIEDGPLLVEIDKYYAALAYVQKARDLLIKCLTQDPSKCRHHILDCIAAAIDAEWELAPAVKKCSEHLLSLRLKTAIPSSSA
jgi:hypothetical protein